MLNRIAKLSDGSDNPSYGWRIQNFMIFQTAAWSGVLIENLKTRADGHYMDVPFPTCGGRSAYLDKTPQVFLRQMEQIRHLNRNMAVANLIMTPEESRASGFYACWNGHATAPAPKASACKGGTWRDGVSLFPELLKAGKARGVPVLPSLSVMGYTTQPSPKEKLRELVENVVQAANDPAVSDAVVRTEDGRMVILVDGFALHPGSLQYPSNPAALAAARSEVNEYYRSRSDILFIDMMIDNPLQPASFPSNVYHWAFAQLADQIYRREAYDQKTNYWYGLVKQALRNPYEYSLASNKFNEEERRRLLNLSGEATYPVIISQYNEYAEYLAFEPNTVMGNNEYLDLRWRLSQQPRLAASEPVNYGSHPDNAAPFNPDSIPCDFGSTSTPAPSISSIVLTSPVNGASFSKGQSVTISASVSGSNIERVEFYRSTIKLGESRSVPYSINIGSLGTGSHSLTAKAFTTTGISKTSDAVSITVMNTPVPTPQPTPPTTAYSLVMHTTLASLQAQHQGCSSANPAGSECRAASNRYCALQSGYNGGFGIVEINGASVQVTCSKPAQLNAMATTFTALSNHHSSCNSDTVAASGACLAATNRFCVSRGYAAGLGIVEYSGNNVSVNCYRSGTVTAQSTSLATLQALKSECSTANPSSTACLTATHRYCQQNGFVSGFGIVEYLGTSVLVNCLK